MAEYECTGSYVVCSKCAGSWCYVKDLPWYPSCWCGRPYPDQAAPVVWPAAAASSSVTVSADAGPAAVPAARVYDIAFFITYKDFTGHWRQHSAALKWFRGDQENAKDPESSQPFTFPNDEKVELPAIIHPPGMDFTFDESKKVKWSWLEMVAQLDDASMTHVVRGPGNSSRGLVGCDIAPRPGSYDHARSVAQAQNAQGALLKLPLWDFVLRREDGSAIRVHPQWKTPKVGSVPDGHFPDVQPPTAGLGNSDGPGTYKHFKDSTSERWLKFRPPVQRQS